MDKQKLSELTTKRISRLSSVELDFSMSELDNYYEEAKELFCAIRHQKDEYWIGCALMKFLRAVNSDDIDLNEGL